MRKILSILIMTLLSLTVHAQDTVFVSQPGMLEESLKQQGMGDILDLAIIGDIDGSDFFYIRNSKCVRRTLDLSQARIVWGPVPYSNYDGEEQYTEDDVAGDYLFAESWLNKIILPISTKRIGKFCFSETRDLHEVVIGDNVEEIDSCAFQWSHIKYFEIPKSLKRLQGYVFSLCPYLQHFSWPAHITSIPPGTFACSGLQKIELPDGLKEIGTQSFSESYNLTHIEIPKTVEKIGIQAFASFNSDTIIIPNSVKSIGIQALAGTTAKRVFLSNQLNVIPTQLLGLSNVEEISIPEGVEKVEDDVFIFCGNLRKLILPSTLKSFEDYMCGVKLDELWCYAPTPPACSEHLVNPYYNNLSSHCILYVPSGSLDLYQAHPQWGGFFKILEMGTEFDPELQFCQDANHPHAIDLGLPSGTKWSCCNVGADTPKGYGDYYAWGEIEEKEIYDWNTYIHCDGTEESCHDIGPDIAGTQYDVAHMKWGGSWTMPSLDQIKELFATCSYKWSSINDVYGGLLTGPSGESIFIPASGYRYSATLYDKNRYGNYWSSVINPNTPYYISFNFVRNYFQQSGCFSGRSVRPVLSATDNITNPITCPNVSDQAIYSIYGIKVADSTDNMNNLPSGIYIVNGKKKAIHL